MKNLAKSSLWLLLTGAMMIAAASCEKQDVEWNFNKSIAIDLPIKGSQLLLDSLKTFLFELQCLPVFYKEDFTKEEDFITPMFTAEDVQVTEFSDLLTSFADKFKGVDNIEDFRENIFLIAQTESFVTYGIERVYSGSSGLYLQTFSKADGHRIHNIINPYEVIRFLFFLGLTYPDSKFAFCDELKKRPIPAIKGFRKDELWKQYGIISDGFHSERGRVWGEEWTQTFYDWWDSQLIDFGLYEPDEDDI